MPPDDDPTTEPAATVDPTPVPPPVPAPEPEAPMVTDGGKRALDAERAARRALEARLKELEPLADEARKSAEARKTAEQKLTEKLASESQRAAAAELQLAQMRAAMAAAPAGMELADIEELASRLRGSTPEELAADATSLFGRLAPATPPPAGNGQRPVEQLRSGALPADTEQSIAQQIAAAERAGDWARVVELTPLRLQEIRSGI